ncbi:MAG: hypothetical protein KBB71_04900 [Lentimicrobiaceae bacterium]|nr:hypothetical protein [Lentimicrobiaceae bacterium]
MKTVIAIISIILMIIGTTIIIARTNISSTQIEVTVMRDITDDQIAQPKLADIVPLVNLDNSQWNGVNVRFIDITDVSYNYTYQTSISAENHWLGNEFDRQKKINNFYAEITQILIKAEEETHGRNNSSVYIPIANELNRLSQSPAQKKIVLVYSDLMENTAEMSFYDKSKFSLLKTNPNSIRQYFDTQVPLRQLAGIKIYLIYQPANPETDGQYQIISEFYKKLLESKGATVEITANIN